MPVTIDEITAEVSPAPPAPPANPGGENGSAPAPMDPVRLPDLLRRLEQRAARVRAD